MVDVAFLVYGGDKVGRRKSKCFDWNGNIGAKMVIDCCERNGMAVDYCSPETAHHYKVVLISLTSTFDIYNLIRECSRYVTWRKRDFRAIAGGFGLQNITPIRHLVDYGVFGRCEDFIAAMVRAILGGNDYEHESVMALEGGLHPVKIGQAECLYPHKLATQPMSYQESEIGCPRKCLFCHYSFSRKYLTANDEQFQGNLGWSSKELLFDRILQDCNLKAKVRTALDGLSERLRYAFNKRLSNELIKETIERLSAEWKGKSPWITVYQIGSYPTETDGDRQEFEEIVRSCEPSGKKVYLDVHVTPFRPSPLTPSAYLPADVSINWHKRSLSNIAHKPLLESYYMACQESPYPHLMSLVAERATEASDDVINTICFSRKLAGMKVQAKVDALASSFDLSQYLREYRTTENLPTWYLSSYIPNAKIAGMADKLKADLGLTRKMPAAESRLGAL